MGRLENRVAVVTGAARGFGRAIGCRLAEEGARVSLWDIDEPRLRETAEELGAFGDDVLTLVTDVRDRAAVEAAARQTRTKLGPIDALVNNAAVVNAALPWEVTDDDWEWHIATNVTGTFHCIRACLPDMRERRYGKIVNFGSLAAQQGRPSANPAYAASKGGVLGLTVSLAHNLGEYGICVNAINPGFIRTEIHDAFTDEQLSSLMADIPLRRRGRHGEHGSQDDIANAVLFLLSEESDYISGEFVSVNGACRTG